MGETDFIVTIAKLGIELETNLASSWLSIGRRPAERKKPSKRADSGLGPNTN